MLTNPAVSIILFCLVAAVLIQHTRLHRKGVMLPRLGLLVMGGVLGICLFPALDFLINQDLVNLTNLMISVAAVTDLWLYGRQAINSHSIPKEFLATYKALKWAGVLTSIPLALFLSMYLLGVLFQVQCNAHFAQFCSREELAKFIDSPSNSHGFGSLILIYIISFLIIAFFFGVLSPRLNLYFQLSKANYPLPESDESNREKITKG